MTFIIIYQREAHAGQRANRDIEQPRTQLERKILARKACDELGIATTVVIDNMMDSVRRAYGSLYNQAYIIDRGGRIVHKEAWAWPLGWPVILQGLLEEDLGEQASVYSDSKRPWKKRSFAGS